jgi:hypothetical protein
MSHALTITMGKKRKAFVKETNATTIFIANITKEAGKEKWKRS